jgi:hypothetical protein
MEDVAFFANGDDVATKLVPPSCRTFDTYPSKEMLRWSRQIPPDRVSFPYGGVNIERIGVTTFYETRDAIS